MNASKSIAAAILFAAAGSVLAQEIYVAPDAGFVSKRTRAEVRAEIDPSVIHGEQNYIESVAQGKRTRAEVRTEAITSTKNGQKVDADASYTAGV